MMKHIFTALAVLLCLTACNPYEEKWEYKIVELPCENPSATFSPAEFQNPTKMLNVMGEKGWELVDTYSEIQTAFPNFGSDEYVTGIRENTRTSVLHFVFKRKLNHRK